MYSIHTRVCITQTIHVSIYTHAPSLSPPSPGRKSAFTSPESLPCALFFVDDRFQNVSHVAEGVPVLQELGVPCTSYHYVPEPLPSSPSPQDPDTGRETHAISSVSGHSGPAYDAHLVDVQISHFLRTGELLRDQEARLRLPSARSGHTRG
jgi:hypothetical protein